ncbi:MAG: (4Fe-4S)-binding protein [Propionibacteriaceae bacterium]|jgi:uncharacterized Fe-S cluster protein YjdI|nr:(4Fe-4S)-binding protein [Propionibacteriaceae bacterium]
MTRRPYYGSDIIVTFDAARCLHAAECVRGLPAVFDTSRKPWVLPDAAAADMVATVVRRCPTGALAYEAGRERQGAAPELGPSPAQLRAVPDGPIWFHGQAVLVTAAGEEPVVRAALCRCGKTANAPHCDASGPCTSWRGR